MSESQEKNQTLAAEENANAASAAQCTCQCNQAKSSALEEIGGPEGPEPTRYGDWERKGRCIDF